MGEIKDYVQLYIEDSDLLDDFAKEFSLTLRANIKSELYEGHGRDTGNLQRNIRTDVRPIGKLERLITGYWDEGEADYGIYVIRGIRGKGKAKAGPIDFLGDGLQKTMEAYR